MFRFQKRIKLFPGVTINLAKKSASVSVGVTGARVSKSTTGQKRATVSAPGTGWSWVKFWR